MPLNLHPKMFKTSWSNLHPPHKVMRLRIAIYTGMCKMKRQHPWRSWLVHKVLGPRDLKTCPG